MCYLSLENVEHGPFHNDGHEVEDKVGEFKKMITQEDRGMPI